MAALHKVFVYGTLKRGQPNHHILLEAKGAARCLGAARLADAYPLVLTRFGIPMLLAKKGEGKTVQGELYEVDESTLSRLDQLEDHPHLYTRTSTLCHMITPSHVHPTSPLHTSGTATVECETYMVFDYTKKALEMPHYRGYDVANLPPGISAVPPANERSREMWDSIYESLHSLKQNYKPR